MSVVFDNAKCSSEGQLRLRSASVVVVGAGGLGCPALQYLGAAGVGKCLISCQSDALCYSLGKIGVIDHDRVELSNLQRQILHTEETIGMYKAESVAIALRRWNPIVFVTSDSLKLSSKDEPLSVY